MYRLLLHRKVLKQLAKIPRNYAQRLADAMRALMDDPRPHQAVHLEAELYRLRVGVYRVVYAVFDTEKVVFVGKVGRRNEGTYRELAAVLAAARRAADDERE